MTGNRTESDVLIVGAGPAGAAAAYWLAQSNLSVTVLEAETLPRYRVCAGGVPSPVLEEFPFDFADVIDHWVTRVRFRLSGGLEVTAPLTAVPVAMVMRERFDYHILSRARATVLTDTPVTRVEQDDGSVTAVTASGDTFRARYLIGADGSASRVARCVGLRGGAYRTAALEAEIPAGEQLLSQFRETALFIFGLPLYGYIWVFPKKGHLSAGIGAFRSGPVPLKRILRQELASAGIDPGVTPVRGRSVPLRVRREPLQSGRVLLVGDAAGLADPLMGEGIRHAVRSARIAAELIRRDGAGEYTRRVDREVGNDLLWAKRLVPGLYRFPRLSFAWGVRNPPYLRHFLRIFAGRDTYRRMALRAVPYLTRSLFGRWPLSDAGRNPGA